MEFLHKIKISIANEKLKSNPRIIFKFLIILINLKNNIFKNPNGRENCFLNKYNSVYVPIPRVANTSLKEMFYRINFNKDINKDNMKSIHNNLNFPKLKREIFLSDKYFKFAFVRNPYDRATSCYFATIKKSGVTDEGFLNGVHRGLLQNSKKFNKEMSFEEFANLISKIPDNIANEHFKSQHTFLFHNNKKIVNFIGKLEYINRDLKKIFSIMKIDGNFFPKKLNTSKNKMHYRNYYNERSKKLIEERYRLDLDLFNYRF